MATVIAPNAKSYAVKNLGWLLRHWQQVEYLGFNYAPKDMNDGQLIAKLRDGTVYFTDFASFYVCWGWLDRPVFRTLRFTLARLDKPEGEHRHFVIGDDKWKRLNRLPYDEFHAALGLR